MQKGSGSGKGNAGTGEPQPKTSPAGGPGRGQTPAILSEPTQQFELARSAQTAKPIPEVDASLLDVDDAWEELASEDSDGEVEALADDDVALAEPSALLDIDAVDELIDEEPLSEGRVDDGLELDDEPSVPQASYELSSRLDVSEEVLEELSFPKHLAATAASMRPLNDPLFDNVPTQQAPEDLRAALLQRALVPASGGAVAKVRVDASAKALASKRADQLDKPSASPASAAMAAATAGTLSAKATQAKPLAGLAPATSSSPAQPAAIVKGAATESASAPAATVAAKKPLAEASAKVTVEKSSADKSVKLATKGVAAEAPAKATAGKIPVAERTGPAVNSPRAVEVAGTAAASKRAATEPTVAVAPSPVASPTPAAAAPQVSVKQAAVTPVAEKAAAKPVSAKPVSAKPAVADVRKVEPAGWSQRVDNEKIKPTAARLGTADVTLIEMGPAPVTSPAAGRSAVDTQPVVSIQLGPATPTLIAAAPILQPVKAPAVSASAASAAKTLGPISIAVPAALLKKDVASSKPGPERSPGEARAAGVGLSGATFVLPSAKEAAAPAARIVTRERPLRGGDAEDLPRTGGSGGGGGGSTARPGAGGSGEPPRDEVRRGVERRVQARAREFSLPALLDVLQLLDYRPDEIEFLGVMSYAFPGSLIHAVDFVEVPRRIVRISLHMGLLSAQSPLPSYFLKYAEQLESDALFDFLGFFDHHLLRRRAASLYPERDRTLFADWSETQAQLLQLIGLTAPSTLHWLFQRVYPELGIEVRRSTERKPLNAEGVVLGNAKLGEACAFGGGTTVPVGGLEVTLYSEEELTPTGTAWAVEASLRLNRRIFSALGETDVYLTVYLVIMEQTSWLMMEDERYLGFEPLWEDMRGDLSPPSPPGGTGPPGRGKGGGGRQAELLSRSRSAYRIHQVQLFSGPIKTGKHGGGGQDISSTQLLAGLARS